MTYEERMLALAPTQDELDEITDDQFEEICIRILRDIRKAEAA